MTWWVGGLGVSAVLGPGAGQVKGVGGRSEREAGGDGEVVGGGGGVRGGVLSARAVADDEVVEGSWGTVSARRAWSS